MSPEDLQEHHVFGELGGVLAVPSEPACKTVGGWRKYDYFMVHPALRYHVRSASVMAGADVAPRVPALLTLEASAHSLVQKVPKQPKLLPFVPTPGCARWQAPWPQVPDAVSSQEELEQVWQQVVSAMETELCELHDLVDEEMAGYVGREAQLAWAHRPLKPPRHISGHHLAPDTRMWRWLARKLADMQRLYLTHGFGRVATLPVGVQLHLTRLQKHLLQQVPQAACLGEEFGQLWKRRLRRLAHVQVLDLAVRLQLEQWTSQAQNHATAGEKRDVAHRHKLQRSFIADASDGAASKLHAISKPALPWAPIVGKRQGQLLQPVEAAAHKAAKWKQVWQACDGDTLDRDAPWFQAPTAEELAELPELTAEDLRGVGRGFKQRTGIGADALQPCSFALLSEEGRIAFLRMFSLIESTGMWPRRLSHVWYFLIPKPGGGLRPIGLLPSTVRIWERLRRPVMHQWMQSQARDYDWAAVGKTAEAATWHQLVLSEGVDVSTDSWDAPAVATVLLDLVKCFEKVQLDHVWRWGCYWGVPRALLRLILQVFSFQRTLIVEGSYSDPVRTLNAIVPGSVFSCAILHIVLLWPCGRLLELFPTIRLTKYVDDLGVTAKGPRNQAADTAVVATRALVDMLEDDLNLEVSRTTWGPQGQLGKSAFLCTQRHARQNASGNDSSWNSLHDSRAILGSRLLWLWAQERPECPHETHGGIACENETITGAQTARRADPQGPYGGRQTSDLVRMPCFRIVGHTRADIEACT